MLELMQDLGYSDTNRPFSVSNDLIFIGKSITVIDGICKTLDTDYAPEDIVKSFLEQRIDIFDLVLDNSFSDLIEMPKKIQQMNQSIFLIDKTTSVLNAKTIALKRQTLQSKLAMGVVIVLQLILICQSL
jgi:predicted unusual protein kinase regulating ubiquinone biosynthesis (AarF/ABC1/UbiB family)